jgi:aminoglycoside phosphotransferase (APT) family kinase protein
VFTAMKMHDDEVDIDAGLVWRLIAAQFPQLADLPVRSLGSTGTVNGIYRVGDRLCARLPRVQRWEESLQRERQWLPRLGGRLTLRIPEPVGWGQPAAEYPFTWAIYRWIEGQAYADGLVGDERAAARDLAGFVAELRRLDRVADAPAAGRLPLVQLDAMTREFLAAAADVIDLRAATSAWERAVRAPVWDGTPAWIHADLLRPNVLVDGGRICAILDFGAFGLGDPATDVVPAWAVFGPAGRLAFRAALGVDDATWDRASGIALHQASGLISYYAVTNPDYAALGQRTVEQVIADLRA